MPIRPAASGRLEAPAAAAGRSGMPSAPLDDLGGVERLAEPLFQAVVAGALPEFRPADARGAVAPDQLAVRVLSDDVVEEDVLRGDDVALHPEHLGDVGDAPGAVAQAHGLDHHVDR